MNNYRRYAWLIILVGTLAPIACNKKTVCAVLQEPLVIVGSSAAGTAAIKTLVAAKYPGKVLWISAQQKNESPYYTVDLPSVFEKKKTIEQLSIFDVNSLPANISPIFGKRVTSITPDEHSLMLDNGQSIRFSKLLLALGMHYKPPRNFVEQKITGIFTFGNSWDVQEIMKYLDTRAVKNVLVVGFGLIAADVIDGLVKERKHLTAHILLRGNKILERYCDEQGSEIAQKDLESHGVKIHTSVTIRSILKTSDGHVKGALLSDGSTLESEMIIFATGPVIQEELFHNAGIKTENGGIWADSTLQTNKKNIFVAGDGVLIPNLTTGGYRPSCKWMDAKEQGKIAAKNMLGKNISYKGSSFPLRIKFLNTSITTCGLISEIPADAEKISFHNGKSYAAIFHKEGVIKGFNFINIKNKLLPFKIKNMIEAEKKSSKKDIENLVHEAFSSGITVGNAFTFIKEAIKQTAR